MTATDYGALCTINWRMTGSLAGVFAKFSDSAAEKVLRTAGGFIEGDIRSNIAGKGWATLGTAITHTVNTQIRGRELTVGAWHAAAGMRHFGSDVLGRISAPGQSKRASKAEWLTIPVRGSPAKGQSYGDMKQGGWKFFRIISKRTGFPVLMGYQGKGKAQPLFALRKSVSHPASPWFPTDSQITARIGQAFLSML